MVTQTAKIHPALKHGGYSATTLLPGEDPAAFAKLHKDLIMEFGPAGALEDYIVANLARLLWRKQNLATFWIARLATNHWSAIHNEKRRQAGLPEMFSSILPMGDPAAERKASETAEAQARNELGGTYDLVELRDIATSDQMERELAIQDRLDAMIDKVLKRLVLVRGVKSLAPMQCASAVPDPASPAHLRRG